MNFINKVGLAIGILIIGINSLASVVGIRPESIAIVVMINMLFLPISAICIMNDSGYKI